MEFWNSLLTEQSWKILQELQKKPFHFILIGGWAAYLWTRTHKSKDIDIIIPEFKDLEYLKQEHELKKNDHLKKYEISIGEIDVDIYLPPYSRLALQLTEIIQHTALLEGIEVVSPEVLLILKQGAEKEREHSVKGTKDRVDILALLLFTEIDFKKYEELLTRNHLEDFLPRLKRIILEFIEINYLGLNPREFKLRRKALLEKLKYSLKWKGLLSGRMSSLGRR